MTVRIIPRLDIKGPNLVKGIHMEGLRVLGKPENFARHYYENGADELIYVDAVASLYGRNSLVDIIRRTSSEVFIPLTVAGGLRSVDDIQQVLRAGADKVAINTAAVERPKLIREASQKFGSSTIVVSIEAIKRPDGTYEEYVNYGRDRTEMDAIEWAGMAVELGAGEIMVTSINSEGTGRGFDVELTRRISDLVPVPVIACGGAGSVDHIYAAFSEGKADAISLASILHYNCFERLRRADDLFESEGNTEFLRNSNSSSRFQDKSLPTIKGELISLGIECRPWEEGKVGQPA